MVTPFTSLGQTVTKTNPQKIYMHYMPWFDTPATLGGDNWGYHWTMNNRDPNTILPNGQRDIASHYYPKIGPYDSRDPHVIENHSLLMKLSGVDGVLIDWYGTAGSNGDINLLLENSNAMVERVGDYGLQFGVVLEDRFARSVDDVKTNVAYLRDNYFNQPEYIRLGPDNDPLMMVFGPITVETEAEWTEILGEAGEDVAMMPLWYQGGEAGVNTDGEYSWIFEDEATDDHLDRQRDFLTHRASNLDLVGGVAYPGFDDFYEEGGVGDIIPFEIPHANGDTLRDLLSLGEEFASDIDFLQLATWNDFGEGTMFEPTVETGFEYLLQLQAYTGVPFGEEELQLVSDLFVARKASEDAAHQAILDDAADAINRLDFALARGLIDSTSVPEPAGGMAILFAALFGVSVRRHRG